MNQAQKRYIIARDTVDTLRLKIANTPGTMAELKAAEEELLDWAKDYLVEHAASDAKPIVAETYDKGRHSLVYRPRLLEASLKVR